MAYLALYRKYRPVSFENLIGQEHIVKTLTNQIINDRLGHAYLFTGTRGTGKTSAAKIFAKSINCQNHINGSACGECEVCKALSDPSNIDVVEIDAASNNGVNEIRDLREKVQYPPISCKYKVYIIDEVHMLTGAAFNALLKTLEEPPKHAIFILATTEVHKIPATILSRCMRFDFKLIPTEKIAELISKIYDEQGKSYEKEAVFAIAKAGDGSIRDALSIADIAISYGIGKLTYDDVMEILGSSGSSTLNEFIRALLNSQSGNVLQIIDRLTSLGKSVGVLVKDVTTIVRDLLVVKTCSDANAILGLPKDKFIELQNIVSNISEERLLRVLSVFSDAENSLKYSNHPRVIFETAAIKASRPDYDYNIDALLARIKALETNSENKKTVVVEKVIKQNVEIKQEEKLDIHKCSEQDIKGRILLYLRRINSEILWNIIQTVSLRVDGNKLIFTVKNKSDLEFINTESNKQKIIDALSDFNAFDVSLELSEKEKYIIKKRFGIGEDSPKTLEAIGKDLGFSKERIRQIEKGSLKKLRRLSTNTELKQYIG